MGLWLTINLEQYDYMKDDTNETGIRVSQYLSFIE